MDLGLLSNTKNKGCNALKSVISHLLPRNKPLEVLSNACFFLTIETEGQERAHDLLDMKHPLLLQRPRSLANSHSVAAQLTLNCFPAHQGGRKYACLVLSRAFSWKHHFVKDWEGKETKYAISIEEHLENQHHAVFVDVKDCTGRLMREVHCHTIEKG